MDTHVFCFSVRLIQRTYTDIYLCEVVGLIFARLDFNFMIFLLDNLSPGVTNKITNAIKFVVVQRFCACA